MKNTRKNRRPSILATSAAALLGVSLMLGTAHAYNPNFWDTNGNAVGLGGTGNWNNNTTANWNDVTGINAAQNWINPVVNNNAVFTGTSGVVTLNNVDGIVTAQSVIFGPTTFGGPAPLGYIVNGPGTLAMTGIGVIQLGLPPATDSTTTFNAVLTDVGGSGITVTSLNGTATSNLILTGTNTFTGAFTVNSGTVTLNGVGNNGSISGTTLNIGTGGGAIGTAVVQNNLGANIANTTAVVIGNAGVLNLTGTDTVGSVASVGGGIVTGTINLSGTGALDTGTNNTSTTYGGTINGTGAATAVLKNGTGIWTLTNANGYTGTTAVNAGALNIQNSTALGAVGAGNGTFVAAGATLQIQGGISVGNEGLILGGAGTGAANQDGALVNVSGTNNYGGALTLIGATTISSTSGLLNLTNATAITGGSPLTLNSAVATGNGNLTGATTNLTGIVKNAAGTTWTLSGANAAFAGPITVNAGTLAAGSLTAFGTLSQVNLVNAGATLDLVGFSNTIATLTGAGGTVVTNSNAATPATLTFGTAASTVFSGIFTDTGVAGALSLVKNGAGTFTLGGTGTNTYSGSTTVNAGILLVNNTGANALGLANGTAAAGTTVVTGASLQLSGGITVGNEALTLAGTGVAGAGALENLAGTNTYGGLITLTGATTIGVTAGTLNLSNAGPIAGGANALTLLNNQAGPGNVSILATALNNSVASLTKTGVGTWRLSGANAGYSNAINVNAGVLQAGSATAFGAGTATGSVVTLLAGGTLDLFGNSVVLGSLAGPVGSFVDNTAAGPVALTTGAAGSTTFAGAVQNTGGALSLTKVGTATVFTLAGANTYTGLTSVNQGMLVAASANALGSGAAAPSATGVAPGITVATGASLELTFAGVVTGSTGPLTLTINGTGTALNGVAAANTGALVAGANSTFDGSIFVASNSTISANGFTLTLGTIAQPTEFINKNGVNLTMNAGGGAGKIIVNEAIVGAAPNSDMIFTNGATDLNVANTYNGITFIDNRGGANGVLNTGVANALPTLNGRSTVKIDSVGGGASTLNIAGTVLNPAGANQSIASLEGIAGSKVTLGANTLTIGFGTGVDVNGTANANFAGVISGAGGLGKDQNSTQILSGLNSYTGTTTVVNGKLQAGVGQVGATGAFGNSANVIVGNAATVAGNVAPTLELAGFNQIIGSLSGNTTGFVQNNFGAVGSTATLTLGSGGASGTFGGVLRDAPTVGAVGAGTLTIVKTGAGTQIFGIAGSTGNTYTGTTTVNGGILQAGVSTNAGNTAGAFGVNSVLTVTAPGIVEMANFNETVDSLLGNGTVRNTIANGPGLSRLTLSGAAGNASSFTGVIQDTFATPLALVINDVNGFGASQALSGQSTYRGFVGADVANPFLNVGTVLNAPGTLNINASDTFNPVPPVGPPSSASGPLGLGGLSINGGTIGTTTAAGLNNAVGNTVFVNNNFAVAGANGTNDGVTFAGNTVLSAGTAVVTTNSGFLDFSGTISENFGGNNLTFAGATFTYIGSAGIGGIPGIFGQLDNSNTYTGLTTVGDGFNAGFVLLGKNNGAVAIPGNLTINPFSTVQFDSFALGGATGTTTNQIAPTSNVLVNGTLDISGINQAINGLTGGGTVRLDDSQANNVGAAGILSVNNGIFNGSIVDAGKGGQLVKNSPGTLILTNANPYVGNTTVNGGSLIVNGSIGSANTTINALGLLGGHGFIKGNVINHGTVSPGTSPGVLTVGGNFTQTSGGTLVIEVAGKQAGQFDVLAVGGAANLDGTVRILNVGSVRLKRGDRLAFLTAGAGVNGQFSNEALDTFTTGTIMRAGVVYESNAVLLAAIQGSFANDLDGLTPNQKSVARALDRVVFDRRADRLIDFLDTELLGNLPHDFDLIAPEELASIYNLGVSLANVQGQNIQRRTGDIRAGSAGFSASGYSMQGSGPANYSGGANYGSYGPAGKGGKELAPPSDNRWGVFVTGVGEFTKIGDTYNARGYDLTTGGFTLGVDYKITPNFAVGISAGYARTGVDLNGNGRITVDGAKTGVYATYFTGTGFYADAAASAGYNSYDTERSALRGRARGSTEGAEFDALFAAGYDWKTGGLTVGPVASVHYTYVGLGDFRERGSLAPLRYENQNGESLRTAVGMKASYDIQAGGVVIRPEVRVAWQHEFGDSEFAIDSRFANGAGNTFTVHGPEIGEDSLLLGAGVAVLWNERTSTYVYYDGELARSNYDSHNVSGGVRVAF